MGVRFGFSLAESLMAELAGVPQISLHTDVDAMVRAAAAIAPVAERLGVEAPRPHLAGLAYVHASTVGCEVVISPGAAEPACRPCIRSPADIDRLREPDDYLSCGVVPRRLALAAELRARCPDASDSIGHDYEGPVTTAALMMGQDFFMLPRDDPARAHKLMEFCVRSAVNYSGAIRSHQHRPTGGGWQGFPDDFGGIFAPDQFAEFVAPYWEQMYQGLRSEHRGLHSELLREEHLTFLGQLKIDDFDPSVDQYLTPEILARSCPVPFSLRMWPAEVMSHSAGELVAMYRHRASFNPTVITFALCRPADEAKIVALLEVARELA